MFRLTRKVFYDLAIWMAGFGAATGLMFPFFAWAMGLPRQHVLSPGFFGACILAGVAVGAANIGLARSVVGILPGVTIESKALSPISDTSLRRTRSRIS